jgi:hypothetical protein
MKRQASLVMALVVVCGLGGLARNSAGQVNPSPSRVPTPENAGSEEAYIPELSCSTVISDDVYEQQITSQVESWLKDRGGSPGLNAVITIPVAMHIIRTNNGQNDVSDARIATQISVLNAAFANTNFQFVLVHTCRVNNSTWFYHDRATDEGPMKQNRAVSPATTLNFYTCSPTGNYAVFPWDYAESSYMHGVVCHHANVAGGSTPYFNDGDIGVHEVGHYTGLYHTFQNGCAGGDLVADTPPEASSASGCPEGRDTCGDPGVDPIHNFMDYTYDYCKDHFTAGQATRMYEQMALYRPTIVPPPPPPPPPLPSVVTTLPTPTVAGLAFTSLGKPAITYVGASPNFRPQFSTRLNGAWTSEAPIEDLNARQPSIAIDGTGIQHAIYLDFGAPGDMNFRALRYARRPVGGAWTPELVYGAVQGLHSQTSDITVDASGSPWIAFSNNNGSVQVARRNGSGWLFETAGIGGALGEEYVNIGIASTGTTAVSWGHKAVQNLYCSVRTAPDVWDRETVDASTDGTYSIENSLAFNAAGQPVVAYYLIGQNQLKIATRLGDDNWSYQVVATNLGTTNFIYPQLEIDASGNLHLTYNDRTAGLKIYGVKIGAGAWTFYSMPNASISKLHYMRIFSGGKSRIVTGDQFWDDAWEMRSPAAFTSWVEGSPRQVAWAGSGNANVEFSPNGGGTWQALASNVPGDEVLVTAPAPTTNGRIRVSRISPAASATVSPITVTSVPPPAVTDLGFVAGRFYGCLWWTAPDDGNGGQAVAYDLRYGVGPINDEYAFANASPWPAPPPQPPGYMEYLDVNLQQCSSYYWAVKTRDAHGVWSMLSNSPGDVTSCGSGQDVLCAFGPTPPPGDRLVLPQALAIGQITPNPARSPVTIPLAIPAGQALNDVHLAVFDIAGRMLRTINAGSAEPGYHTFEWDLRDSDGRTAANGVYFVRVRVGNVVENRRMLLVR